LTAKFGYSFLRRDIDGITNTGFQWPRSYTTAPMLEVNFPLWRNLWGSEFKAMSGKVTAGDKGEFYRQRATFDGIAVAAETAYNGLFFARQTTQARADSLELAKKLLDWMSKRASNELADDNDLNQAKAAYEQRELELLKAQTDERKSARAFNSLRGIESDKVEEKLIFTPASVDLAKRVSNLVTDQVRAAEQKKEAAQAEMRLALENTRPTFDVFAKYSHNGLDAHAQSSVDESWGGDFPYSQVGVKFEAPIFFWENKKVNDGYRRALAAADLELKRTYEENARDLNDLYAEIETAQKLVVMSEKLVDTQKKKLAKERERHRRGRTTLYQVLQYEQEFVQTQLAQIQYQSQLVGLANQLRLYRGQ
jgi:outer membrane protein TolC